MFLMNPAISLKRKDKYWQNQLRNLLKKKYCQKTNIDTITAWKVSKYRVFPYFPVLEPEKSAYLDTFHTVNQLRKPFFPPTTNKAN